MVVGDAKEPESDCMGEEGLGSLKLKLKCSKVCSGERKEKKKSTRATLFRAAAPMFRGT